jgi:hypothetical protein
VDQYTYAQIERENRGKRGRTGEREGERERERERERFVFSRKML